MTASQIPAIKTQKMGIFWLNKKDYSESEWDTTRCPCICRSRVSIFHEDVFVTGIPPCTSNLSIIIFTNFVTYHG